MNLKSLRFSEEIKFQKELSCWSDGGFDVFWSKKIWPIDILVDIVRRD